MVIDYLFKTVISLKIVKIIASNSLTKRKKNPLKGALDNPAGGKIQFLMK